MDMHGTVTPEAISSLAKDFTAAARGRISITTSHSRAVAKCISRSTENPSSLYPFLQRRDLRLIHAQQPRHLGLGQLPRRQNRVQRGRQPHLRPQLFCIGQPKTEVPGHGRAATADSSLVGCQVLLQENWTRFSLLWGCTSFLLLGRRCSH